MPVKKLLVIKIQVLQSITQLKCRSSHKDTRQFPHFVSS